MLSYGLVGLFLGIFIGGGLGVAGGFGAINGAYVFGPIGYVIGVLAAPRDESVNGAIVAIRKGIAGLLKLILVLIGIWAITLWWYYQPEERCGSNYREFASKEGISIPSSIESARIVTNIKARYTRCLKKHTFS